MFSQKQICTQLQEKPKKAKPKDPSKVFTRCLSCQSTRLLPIGPDVQCIACPWNSFAAHVNSGGFDNFFASVLRSKTTLGTDLLGYKEEKKLPPVNKAETKDQFIFKTA